MTTGAELLKFVKEIRIFSRQLAELLGTTDKLMGDEGWESASASSSAFASSSSSLDSPHKWFPYEVARFYRSDERRDAIAFVSVLLDEDRHNLYQLTEPLLTAGWFEFTEAAPESITAATMWWARFHGYMDPRRDEGEIQMVEPSPAWDPKYDRKIYPFHRAHTLGVPLASVTTADVLRERIVARLLGGLRAAG